MKTDLAKKTVTEVLSGLRQKAFSAQELTQVYLQAIHQSDLNAFLSINDEGALAAAAESDKRLTKGEGRALEGLPIAIKDNIAIKGQPMTAGSKILENFVPPYDATVVQRLKDKGAVLLGKTNMDEFAMGSSNMTSFFGPVKNPWRSKTNPKVPLVPGGSSGGSAAAVAACLAPASLGTDTGGSIRQPASFCGLVGLKPTYGLMPRWGVVALASSFDQVGPFAKTVEDAALLLEHMGGHDVKEATSSHKSVPPLSQILQAMPKGGLQGLKVGIPKEYTAPQMDADIQRMWDEGAAWLKAEGAEIVNISLPHTKYALQTYTVIMFAEASSNLARFDGVRYGFRAASEKLQEVYQKTRDEGFCAEVKRRILLGSYILSQSSYEAYFCKAQKVRRLIANDFQQAFNKVDVVLTPTAPTGAFALGDVPDDPTVMYLNDVFTVPINLAGLPAVSVPVRLSPDGLPLGLQVIGRAFDEVTMLKAALCLEKAAAFPRFDSCHTSGAVA